MKNVNNLSLNSSILSEYLYDLRSKEKQTNPTMFRKNMKRVGSLIGYEISKHLSYQKTEVITVLGTAKAEILEDKIILATILRAGLTLHEGLLDIFDNAQNTFIGSYRKEKDNTSTTLNIALDYITSPNIFGSVLIICDPMLATGSSMVTCIKALLERGTPKAIHLVSLLATPEGIAKIHSHYPDITIWCTAIDPNLDYRKYIIPGLGDAGDLAYGIKE